MLKKLLQDFLPDARAVEMGEPAEATRVTLYALLALIVTALLWATFSNVDRVVTARGRLINPLPNMVVQPLEPGLLKTIDVRVGQVVKKGALLATLDPTFTSADAAQLGVREDTLKARAQRLELELQGKGRLVVTDPRLRKEAEVLAERRANYEARLKQSDETAARLRATLETNHRDQESYGARLKTLNELEEMYVRLESQKFGSKANLLNVREKRYEVQQLHAAAVSRENEIRREIAAGQAERQAFIKSWRQKVSEEYSDISQQRDEVSQQAGKARRRFELVRLEAPEDAVVMEIGKKSVGSVVKDAEPLFILVPLNAVLEAEVEVSPGDVGDLRAGDMARIKIDTFPFQKHGTLNGELTSVSADAFTRQGSQGSMAGESYYFLARVALKETRLNNVSETARLLPGMTMQAELVVGKRSVISYFLYPVIRILDESIRE
jgi:hemolysin D